MEGKKRDRHGRFRRRYYKAKRQERRSPIKRVWTVTAGAVVAVAGLVLMPLPGPGLLIFVLGLGMLAGEFLFVAVLLDRAEGELAPRVIRLRDWMLLHRWAASALGLLVAATGLAIASRLFFDYAL